MGAVRLCRAPRLTSVVIGKRGKGRLCRDSSEELQLQIVALFFLDFKDTQLDFYRLLCRDNLHAQGRFPITTLVRRSSGGDSPGSVMQTNNNGTLVRPRGGERRNNCSARRFHEEILAIKTKRYGASVEKRGVLKFHLIRPPACLSYLTDCPTCRTVLS